MQNKASLRSSSQGQTRAGSVVSMWMYEMGYMMDDMAVTRILQGGRIGRPHLGAGAGVTNCMLP
jgi:hypothetical protein